MKAINEEMVNSLIEIAESDRDGGRAIQEFIDGLEPEQQAEFQALMWFGRDDAVDGPIPFAEHVEHSKEDLEHVGGYMSEKSLVLADYLRNGLKLGKERGEF